MVKKKKRLWIVLGSFLCLLAILFSMYCFLPYPKHLVRNKTTIETDQFLPKPDDIIYIENGIGKKLTDAQRDAVYEEFMILCQSVYAVATEMGGSFTQIEIAETIFKGRSLEFRYEQRHKFIGKVQGSESPDCIGEFEFDAVLITLGGSLIPYVGIAYRGYGERRTHKAIMWQGERYQMFESRLYEILG